MQFFTLSLMALILALFSGCSTNLKVAQIDNKTGLLASESGSVAKASVLTSVSTSLSRYKRTVYLAEENDYVTRQIQALKLFDRIIRPDDLQRVVVQRSLHDTIPSLQEPIGLSKLAKASEPILWLGFRRVVREEKGYMQLVATDAESLDILFSAEIILPTYWREVTDQNMRYPLFNEFVVWARSNP